MTGKAFHDDRKKAFHNDRNCKTEKYLVVILSRRRRISLYQIVSNWILHFVYDDKMNINLFSYIAHNYNADQSLSTFLQKKWGSNRGVMFL